MGIIKKLWPFKNIYSNITTVTLLGMCALSFYNLINPTKEIGRGSFTDSQTTKKYEYVLYNKGHSKNLCAWPEGSFPIIAPITLTDSNLDGLVDSQGILSRDINPEQKERAQRLYNLALDDSKK